MPQPREQGKKAQETDLRSQLEKMQKRIDHETEEALSKRDSKRHAPFSSILSKRDKRTSMPVFAGSSTHNNVVNNNSSKDVNFVVGLSENLLLECRRLQADNEKKSLKFRSLQQEYDSLQSRFEVLSANLQGTQQESLSLKDTNWELETKLQNVSQHLRDLKQFSEKTQKELAAQLVAYKEIRNEFDETTLERQGLREELKNAQQRHLINIAELKQNIVELNEENDSLQQKLDKMTVKVDQLTERLNKADLHTIPHAKVESSDLTASTELIPETLTEDRKTTFLSDSKSKLTLTPHDQSSIKDLDDANLMIDKLKSQIVQLKRSQKVFSPKQKEHHKKIRSTASFEPQDHNLPAQLGASSAKHVKRSCEEKLQLTEGSFDDSNCSFYTEEFDSHNNDSDIEVKSDISETMDAVRNPILEDLGDDDSGAFQTEYSEAQLFAKAHNLILLPQDEYDAMIAKETISGRDKSNAGSLINEFAFNELNAVSELERKGYKVHNPTEFESFQKSLACWSAPSIDYLKSKATELNSMIISYDEYESLKCPSLETLKEQASEMQCTALSNEEFKDQQNQIKNPSLSYLEKKINEHGKVLVSKESYDKLQEPTLEDMNSHATLMGCKLVKSSEWESMRSALSHPTLEFLSESAKKMNYSITPSEIFESLSQPSLAMLSQRATEVSHILLSNAEYQRLNSIDRQWVVDKASSLDLEVLDRSDYNKLENPTMEWIEQKAKSVGCVVLSEQDHHDLVNPSVGALKLAAAERGCIVVPKLDIDDLHDKLNTPDETFIRAKALDLDLRVLEIKEFERIKAELECPTLNTIKSTIEAQYMDSILSWLAQEHHLITLQEKEHRDLVALSLNPTLEQLEHLAASKNHSLINSEELGRLNGRLKNPNVDYLVKHIETHNKAVVDTSVLADLREKAEHPNIEYLSSHARLNGLHLSNINELENLKVRIEEPDFAYLLAKSKASGYVLVGESDHLKFTSHIENPEKSFLESKLSDLGYVSLKEDDLSKLQNQIEKPERSFLESKLSDLGYVALKEEDLSKLHNQLEKPERSFLETKSRELGLTLLQEEDLSKLHNQLEKPEMSFLESKLSGLGYVALKEEDLSKLHNQLEKPERTFLETKSRELGLTLLQEEDLSKLHNQLEKPEMSFLESKLSGLGYVTLKEEDLSKLHNQLEKPGRSFLEAKLKNMNLIPVAVDEYSALQKRIQGPGLPYLEDKLKKLGFIAVKSEEYRDLQDNTEVRYETFFDKKLKNLNLVAVNADDYEILKQLAESSKKIITTDKNQSVKSSPISSQEASAMKAVADDTETYILRESEGLDGLVLIAVDEKKSLDSKDREGKSPSLSLQDKLISFGFVTMSDKEPFNFNDQVAKPNMLFIETKDTKYGAAVVGASELRSLRDTVENPQMSFLERNLSDRGFIAMREGEHAGILQKINCPDTAYLQEKLGEVSMVAITKSEYSELMSCFESPDLYFLTSKLKDIGFVPIKEDELSGLKNSAQSPKFSFMESKLKEAGYVSVTFEKYSALEKCAQKPQLSFLEEKARDQGFVLVSDSENRKRTDLMENPTLSYLKEKARGYEVVPIAHYESLTTHVDSPSLEFLNSKSEAAGYSLLPAHIHKELLRKLENPTLEELELLASGVGFVVVADKEFSDLNEKIENPSWKYLSEKTKSLGLVAISQREHEELIVASQDDAAFKKIEEKGFKAVGQKEFADLIGNNIRDAGIEQLQPRLEALGYTSLSLDEFSDLKKPLVEKLDPVVVSLFCEKNGYVMLEQEELDSLRHAVSKLSIEDLENLAGKHDSKLISLQDFNNLCEKAETPAIDAMQRACGTMGLVLVSKDSHQKDHDMLENPTADWIASQAERSGKVLTDKGNYDLLLESVETPSLEYLQQKVALRNLHLVAYQEYHKLLEQVRKPTIEFLKEKADALDLILVHKEELTTLKNRDDSYTDDDLKTKATELKKVVIDESEYRRLLYELEHPGKEYLKSASEELGFMMLEKDDYNLLSIAADKQMTIDDIFPIAARHSYAILPVADLEDLKNGLARPSVEYLSDKAAFHGQQLVSAHILSSFEENFKSIQNPTLDFVSDLATAVNCAVLPVAQYEEMKTSLENPSEAYLKTKGKSLGFAVIDQPLYESQVMEQSTLESLKDHAERLDMKVLPTLIYEDLVKFKEHPNLEFIKEKLELYPDYVLLSKIDHEVLKASLNNSLSGAIDPNEKLRPEAHRSTSSFAARKQFFEDVIREEGNQQSKEKIVRCAKALGLVTLNSDEYKELMENQKETPLSKSQLYNSAKLFELTVLPSQEYLALLEDSKNPYFNSNEEVGPATAVSELRVPSSQSFTCNDSQSRNVVEPAFSSTSSRSSISESFYYDALQSAVSELHFNESVSSFETNSAHYTDALGEQSLSRTSTVREGDTMQSISISELREQAYSVGYVLVRQNSGFGGTDLESEDDGLGVDDTALALTQSEDDAGTHASSVSSIDTAQREWILKEKAAKLGLFVITEDEHAEFECLKKLTMVDSITDGYMEPLRDAHYIEKDTTEKHWKTKCDCTRKLSGNQIGSIVDDASSLPLAAAKPGFGLLPKTEDREGFRREAMAHESESFGENNSCQAPKNENKQQDDSSTRFSYLYSDNEELTVLGKRRDFPVAWSSSTPAERLRVKAELIEKAHEFGLVSLEADQFAQIKEELAAGAKNLTLDDIMIKSAEFDLVPLPRGQFEQIKAELSNPTLTKEQIVENAADFGLVAVEKVELDKLNRNKHLGTEDEFTSSGIEESELSEDNEDRNQIDSLAKKLGLMCIPESAFVATTMASVVDTHNVVVLPSSYYDHILAKEQEGVKMATIEELQIEARKRGLVIGPRNSPVQQSVANMSPHQSRVSRQASIRSNVSSESNSRRSLAEAAVNAAYNDHEVATIKSRGHRHSLSSNRQTILNMDVDVTTVRHASFDGGISLATVASLSEPSIIPALTQTVIGEYLHKYYRRLGPFSNVTSRHERYFWVHPYTMTLYWSTNNPVLENPATNKTRAAAILGIESVEDPNPYPAGLYHKSIVVKTETRPIKITCATRQRHNIWFNSLRYLIQRNMDGINLDDTAADPADANKIYQLPGETPKLTNQRLSSTRRGMSAGSTKRPASTRTLNK
ncbi:LANO_0H04940g1_1 [Lachancea nothofagi CBS 11611]|uniref:LANO_0H04940g1_1 n=1 Tax=Lachancea nothofagi CBS 11611 TaxID=1266666 RepID=A0A1G4KL74_9SACH|nr:LANO_0H04940g1_1 [Lachancea nothofagi CBS 11611]